MASQIQVTITRIGNASQGSGTILSFPTSNILISQNGVGSIITFLEQDFFNASTVAELLALANTDGTSMIQATVLRINDSIQTRPIQVAFPTSQIQIQESIVSGSNSLVKYNLSNYYCSDDADTLITAANAGGGGGSSYLSKTVELTDAEIKALPTTGINIIDAPGSGKVIILKDITYITDFSVAYTNISGANDAYFYMSYNRGIDIDAGIQNASGGWGSVDGLTSLFTTTGGSIYKPISSAFSQPATNITNPFSAALANSENLPITVDFFNNDGNLTGGDPANTMKIILGYEIIDL